MDGHSGAHGSGGRSHSSQSLSPCHSAPAPVSSSAHHKHTIPGANPSTPSGPFSPSDTGNLASDDRLDRVGASEDEQDKEEVDADEDENGQDKDMIHAFTAFRIKTSSLASSSRRRNLPKQETKMGKIESSGVGMSGNGGKDDLRASGGASGQNTVASASLLPGIIVKENIGKDIYTENIHTSGAYIAREEGLQREEDAGLLKIFCCANDGLDDHMIWLIGLKNVYARQLPNMRKEYIVRLVMDRSHKSMMVIRGNKVFGGITYRPFISQSFGELAFCAVTGDKQAKGYGTRLMNHLKQHARDVDGLTHLLTYADNNAVGYFMKQGFKKEISLGKEKWQEYIKDYVGVTLMECKIDPKLPYTDLATMIRRQRQAIDEEIRKHSNCHIVYPGIDFQKADAGIPRKPIEVEDIPGLREAGWTPDQWGHSRFLTANTTDRVAYRQQLNNFMWSLLKTMDDHPDAWPFREPVDARDAPDYYDIIKDPMDINKMLKRLESEQYYVTLDMFVADARRMFANARTYNPPESIYFKCSLRLEKNFLKELQALLMASYKKS